MGHAVNRLTTVEIRNLHTPGRHGDGGGLYLEILPTGQRRWLLRYQLRGRRRDMTLGALTAENGLGAARQAAQAARGLIGRGIDPIDDRRRPTGVPTFAEHAATVLDVLSPAWSPKTRYGWELSLLTHAAAIGTLPVDQVGVVEILRVLKPLWTAKANSAGKLRERIERVLDHARVVGLITGPWENPARWRGHLAFMLPKLQRLQRGHMPALPYAKAPAFVARLRAVESMGARALDFAILTVAREGMVMGARWPEIVGDVWIVPAARMKLKKEFRVPLTPAALAVLDRVSGAGREGYIFKGARHGTHISNATMDGACANLTTEAVPHGFRSTFRDWAGDCTDHAREVAEACLAHAVGSDTETSYRRGDALAKRRLLLTDWAAYLGG